MGLAILLLANLVSPAKAFQEAKPPVVQGVMFWLESCGHCQYVMEEVLPPLQAQYGEQLDIVLVLLVTTDEIDRLYQTGAAFGIAKEDVGVPFLVIGDRALSGANQIAEELPGLIEQHLAQGGVNVPDTLSDLLPTPEAKKAIVYLFWGDGCPMCAEAKPALQNLAQRYPNVEVREFEIWYQEENKSLFYNMAVAFRFMPHYVPTIFIGEQYWEGYSDEIRTEIENAITACLEGGCPDAGESVGVISEPTKEEVLLPNPTVTAAPEIAAHMQPNGFALATIVLIAMAAALLYAIFYLWHEGRQSKILPLSVTLSWWRSLGMLALCLIGLGVAGYLAYVETRLVEALCGPVGDCNTVQSSSYARLFGILPVGVLGVAGYLAILAGWLYPRLRRDRWARFAPRLVLGMTIFGVLFSIYLTYLEIFVIRAVCLWCLASAVIMTLLMLLSLKPAFLARQRFKELRKA